MPLVISVIKTFNKSLVFTR